MTSAVSKLFNLLKSTDLLNKVFSQAHLMHLTRGFISCTRFVWANWLGFLSH